MYDQERQVYCSDCGSACYYSHTKHVGIVDHYHVAYDYYDCGSPDCRYEKRKSRIPVVKCAIDYKG